ncbi:hypothetical protein MAM1_0140d06373 [Mucor ambiguus]|uniref:Rho-GAP domain-containing protein n=1 Tax=Mucor ambiguus TaxID=91626 RepID=A0A0C9MXH3_9FUNG|nr:hypothetical protein MAM1_0140d06373 [Mucor ambiguus]
MNDAFCVIDDYKYHKECLRCPGCTISSSSDMSHHPSQQLYRYNDRPYCRYHYSLIKGTECIGCGQTVFEQNDTLENWHTECYMLKRYYHVELVDLQLPYDYTSRQQLEHTQDSFENLRYKIWHIASQFENEFTRMISDLAMAHHPDQLLNTCQSLFAQISILFTVLDLLFVHVTHVSYIKQVQSLTQHLVFLLDATCQQQQQQRSSNVATENRAHTVTKIATHIRHLVRLGLQQAMILERNFRLDIIDDMLALFIDKQCLKSLNLACLDHHLQLLDMAIARVLFVLDLGKRPDETLLYKPTINQQQYAPALSHQYTQKMANDTLSKSNSISASTRTISRMQTFKRALTTTSRRKNSSASSSNTSTNTTATTVKPMYISLPDVEQLHQYHASPPLSPPTTHAARTTTLNAVVTLPELTLKQDCIIRHIAVLHVESHVDDSVLMDDLLNGLSKKPASSSSPAASLWGKLKTHILTPTMEYPSQQHQQPQQEHLLSPTITTEKKIGVSLCNLSHGSLKSQSSSSSSDSYERWKAKCPLIDACFSSQSLVPDFLKDCILALINQDITTEGIFRKSGNIRGLKDMCETLDSQPNRHNWLDFFQAQSNIQLAAFIKRFLRELPEPLLTWKLHKLFIMSSKATTLIGALNIMHYAICILPKPNRDILLTVLALLHWVAQHSVENKMDYENLARVMAPNILYTNQEKEKKQQSYDLKDISTCHGEIWVISTMIQHYEKFFQIPNDFVALLEHPRMMDYTCTNSVDLTSTKQFVKSYQHLLKIKKDAISTALVLPPSPSHSSSK